MGKRHSNDSAILADKTVASSRSQVGGDEIKNVLFPRCESSRASFRVSTLGSLVSPVCSGHRDVP